MIYVSNSGNKMQICSAFCVGRPNKNLKLIPDRMQSDRTMCPDDLPLLHTIVNRTEVRFFCTLDTHFCFVDRILDYNSV